MTRLLEKIRKNKLAACKNVKRNYVILYWSLGKCFNIKICFFLLNICKFHHPHCLWKIQDKSFQNMVEFQINLSIIISDLGSSEKFNHLFLFNNFLFISEWIQHLSCKHSNIDICPATQQIFGPDCPTRPVRLVSQRYLARASWLITYPWQKGEKRCQNEAYLNLRQKEVNICCEQRRGTDLGRNKCTLYSYSERNVSQLHGVYTIWLL